MRQVLAILFVVACIGLTPCQLLEQPFLTLQESEDTVTFSVVAKNNTQPANETIPDAELNKVPILQLFDIDARQNRVFLPTASRNYSYTFPDGVKYAKTSHFFTIPVVRGHKYSWSVIANNSLGPYQFKLRDYKNSLDTRMIILADIDDSESTKSTWHSLQQLNWSEIDGVVGLGDYAYEIYSDYGVRGDRFFQKLSDYASKSTPTYLISGNHEKFDGFKFFNYRFRMPHYNSAWDNNVYTVLENSALFLFVNFDWILTKPPQVYSETLAYASSLLDQWKDDPRVRWRVFGSHRPLYCSEVEIYSCIINPIFFKPFDDLLRKHQFDVYLAGHNHLYERLNFVDHQMQMKSVGAKLDANGQKIEEFTDPGLPLLVVSGTSGYLMDSSVTQLGDNSLTRALITHIPGYLDLRYGPNYLQVLFVSSADGHTVDGVRITKTTPFNGSSEQPRQASKPARLVAALGILTVAVLAGL